MRLLLDEHMSPRVAAALRDRGLDAVSLPGWRGGSLLGLPDEVVLMAAAEDGRVFVTYDLRTMVPLLKRWSEEDRHYAGVILVDAKTIPPDQFGRLATAVEGAARESGETGWSNRVVFLRSPNG